MNEIIKKVIEQGFKVENKHLEEESGVVGYNKYSIVLDKKFWVCLGDFLKWEAEHKDGDGLPTIENKHRNGLGCSKYCIPEWSKQWVYFTNYLIAGGEVEDFFNDLLTN